MYNYSENVTFVLLNNKSDMKFSEMHRRLEQAGWYIFKETGHRYYAHKDFPYLIKVGRHGSKEVPPNEFNKVMKKAGLK